MKESYLYDFKLVYYKKLLLAGFNNSSEVKTLVYSDQSGYGEIILTQEDYKIIDSLVDIDNRMMIEDSIRNIGTVSEGAQGKRVFNYALMKYNSKWLDKISHQRYMVFFKKNKR